jgi:hypothetical protein
MRGAWRGPSPRSTQDVPGGPGMPRKAPGSPGMPQKAPGRPRTLREAPGDPRRPREARASSGRPQGRLEAQNVRFPTFWTPQDGPGSPGKPREAPGSPGKLQEAPGGPREAQGTPGSATRTFSYVLVIPRNEEHVSGICEQPQGSGLRVFLFLCLAA